MTLTNAQKERLVGKVAFGESLDTACGLLGVSSIDLMSALDADPMFRISLYGVQALRDITGIACSKANIDRLHDEFKGLREDTED